MGISLSRLRQIIYYFLPPQQPIWRPFLNVVDSPLEKRPYYLHVEDRLDENHWDKFDEHGIPIRGTHVNPIYNITTICAYALAHWNIHITELHDSKVVLLSIADWLVNHQVNNGAWLYHHDSVFGIKAPWVSAMAQGEALSVLARAYAITHQADYMDVGNKAITLFERDVLSGGVVRRLNNGGLFFEEVPSDPPSYILNGFLYALFGLYDWKSIAPEPAQTLLASGLNSLNQVLKQYDLGYWSRYDRYPGRNHAASFAYHDLHIAQLEIINHLMPKAVYHIEDIIDDWRKYRRKLPYRMQAAWTKTIYTLG